MENRIIVSSKVMKNFLRLSLIRWAQKKEYVVKVVGEKLKIPDLASIRQATVYSEVDFEITMMRNPMRRLFDLCSFLSDQPISITFGYSSITVNTVIL